MSRSKLPARPSLEYLRKLARERLREMRRTQPATQLAAALLAIAREHGFASWRALKAEVDRQNATDADRFFLACKQGDTAAVRAMLRDSADLVHVRERHHATGLYFAAAGGHVDTVRALLDARADPGDRGDVEELGVIGWVTCYAQSDTATRDVLPVLLAHGARHHIFSALALGDPGVVRTLVEENPAALDERMSSMRHRQTPLHFAITRARHDLLDLLIELGADIDAPDGNGQTPLEYAMLRSDDVAADRLLASGARKPQAAPARREDPEAAVIGGAVRKGVPIVRALDIAATLRWYTSIGFTEVGRYPGDGTPLFWGMVSLGGAELMFERGTPEGASATLLLVTDRIEDLYRFLQSRQMRTADVAFVESLHEPIFGGLQFSVRDPNGYVLRFLQEAVV